MMRQSGHAHTSPSRAQPQRARFWCTAVALLGLALVFSPPVLSASPVGVQVERSTLGIRLSTSGALLSTVLAEVGKLAGLSVEGLEHVSGPVTADFDLPVDLALRRLLRNYNFILIEGTREAKLHVLGPAGSHPGPAAQHSPSEVSPQLPLLDSADVENLAGHIGDEAAQVLRDAFASPELEARLTALSGVAQYGPEAVNILAAAVRDPDPAVRFTAMQLLAGAGEPAVPHLVRVFREADDPELRVMALSAVAGIGDAVSEEILTLAAHDPDARIRAHAEELSRSLSSVASESGD